MKVTLIPSDNTIIVNGDARHPAGVAYPEGVHAIQWGGESGTIERKVGPQEVFTDVGVVQPFIDAHAAKKLIDETPAVITFAQAKATELAKFRADRLQMFFVIASMSDEAKTDADTPVVIALDIFRQGLKDLPSHPAVIAATTHAALKAAMSAQYGALVAALPVGQKLYFKDLMA